MTDDVARMPNHNVTPEEQIAQLASTLHQRCHDYWETLSDEVRKGTTFHGADAHHAEAKRILGEQTGAQSKAST